MPATPERAKHTASKYDFVKVRSSGSVVRLYFWYHCVTVHVTGVSDTTQVKVWLGEGMSHYYVLSRFLISRVLTVTKIPYMKVNKADVDSSESGLTHQR